MSDIVYYSDNIAQKLKGIDCALNLLIEDGESVEGGLAYQFSSEFALLQMLETEIHKTLECAEELLKRAKREGQSNE